LELAAARPNFNYHPVVSREGEVWKGLSGRVQDLFTQGVLKLNPVRDHVFLCGNPQMVDGVESLLIGQGFVKHTKKAAGNIHVEKYW
jgi:ferredoxin--NADP+ reductase